MKSKEEKIIEHLDRAGFVFLFIFAASLTTSIFVNQIGYFGALLIMLFKNIYQKKFEIKYTGLEYLFIALIVSEIISSILSENLAQSFLYGFKRAILLPVIYLPEHYLNNDKRFRRIFFGFLAFAVAGMLVYLFFAYRHYILQFYAKEGKGPSIFQYVMTAGGLISIVTLIIFSFLFQKDLKLKFKILTLACILISFAALFSSYTRAAWVGTAAGILTIIIIKKEWLLLGVISVIALLFISTVRNKSELLVYELPKNQKPLKINSYRTEGRAYSFSTSEDKIYLADYNEGILVVKIKHEGKIDVLKKVETPAPVISANIRENILIALLYDSRLLFYEVNGDSINLLKTFIPPRRLSSYYIKNNLMFISEMQDGFSVVDISDVKNPVVLKSLKVGTDKEDRTLTNAYVQSSIAYFTCTERGLLVYDVVDIDHLKQINEFKTDGDPSAIFIDGKTLYLGDGVYGIRVLDISNPKNIQLKTTIKIGGNVGLIQKYDRFIFATDLAGNFYRIDLTKNNSVERILSVDGKITDAKMINDNLWITSTKINRFSSITDPYHFSNVERINQLEAGIKIFQDYPLFGVGDIDLNEVYKQYRKDYEKFTYGHLHNNFLTILVKLGIFGFIIYVILLIKIFLIHVKSYKLTEGKGFYNSIATGVFASFIGITISGLFEHNFGDHEIVTMLWFLTGVSLAIRSLAKDR